MIRIRFNQVKKNYDLTTIVGIKEAIFNFFTSKKIKKTSYTALDSVSFEILDKEIVGIVGNNGAGKSTLLAMIAGVIYPNDGEVVVNGKIAPLLELGAGFHPELTGRENIVLNGLILGLRKKEILSAMDEIINFSGLNEFIDQPIRTYSSGMVARLGFSVAIQTKPNILLIDEVLSVGDADFQRKSIEKIFEYKKQGVTIVFVSHDLNAVEMLCDKVIWLENHKVKKIGQSKEIVRELSHG
jgi:lipopolysaccharide transport system ATP-binding protein